jgi:hypothetical protein
MTKKEAYDLLKIPGDASRAEIDAAFRKASKTTHPDTERGHRDQWDRILQARDLLIEPSNGQAVVPLDTALELARTQERAIVRHEQVRRHEVASERAMHAIVRRQTSRLDERRRTAWAFGVSAGGIGALVLLLRAVALTGLGDMENGIVVVAISILSIGAGVAAAVGWVYRTRAERIGHFVEDATTQLSNRGQYIQVLSEIEREGGHIPPWRLDELEEAVDEWSLQVGIHELGSLASSALRIGHRDFAQLLITKGVELDLLAENIVDVGGGTSITYSPKVAESVS